MEFCSKKKLQVVVLVRPIHLLSLILSKCRLFCFNQSKLSSVNWFGQLKRFECIVHSDFAVFSICNGFEIFIFKFLFFWNDDGSNNLWISFLDNFFFHILNHRKLLGLDLIVVESLIQGCQCVSCCQWYLSVKWYGHIKFIATGWFTEFKFGKDWRISKIIICFSLAFFLLIISLQTCIT